MSLATPRKSTLRLVAERAGVAPITASRILNGSQTDSPIAADTRVRVENAARELGYRVDGSARAMRRQRTGQVGAILVNGHDDLLTNPAAFEYVMGLNAGLGVDGTLLSLIRINEIDGHAEGIRALDERLFDAFVVISHLPSTIQARLERQAEISVWIDTNVDRPTCCLRRDETAAAQTALDLLLVRRRRIIWAVNPHGFMVGHYSHAARDVAVRQRCADLGIELVLVPIGYRHEPDWLSRIVPALTGPECGLLLGNPTQARGCLSLFVERGLVPGRDFGVACCDADALLGQQWPALSRIQVARSAIGQQAGLMLADLIRSPEHPPASQLITSPVVPGATA